MSKTLRIDPVTRVEGHLAVDTHVENGRVAEARVAGRMYRGFEQLLVGRHPVDAARITQRICGICHEVHGIAASIALEDLYGIVPSNNGLILRDLILGLHLVTDHIFHFYQLTLPDYLDFSRLDSYRGSDEGVLKLARLLKSSAGTFSQKGPVDAPADNAATLEMALGYAEAVRVRKMAASGLASLGGKVPFCHAILPGGVTTGVTSDRLMNYARALEVTSRFIRGSYLPHALALATFFPDYFEIGRSHGNFYANGGFSLVAGTPLFKPGVFLGDRGPGEIKLTNISEVEDASFRVSPGPDGENPAAYSWVKALHYDGVSMEVGPLARMVVSQNVGFRQRLKGFRQPQVKSSVMARILARACEADIICRYLLELLGTYRANEPTIHSPDMLAKPSGDGYGMSLAARGALNHQVTAVDGKVVRYRLQVPSAWNFGPTARGQLGTVEAALVGTPLKSASSSGKDSVEVGRIIRSFDPCLACAIH
ncbi:MAG: hypothetical protein C0614_09825 [Desulfuromonas sp.]|nr:MAG: hypothetical protein C0614_09825 [Desulfuromonas sp.]